MLWKYAANLQKKTHATFMHLCNLFETTLRHECSPVNLLHIFETPFTKNTSEWLFLNVASWFDQVTYVCEECNNLEDQINIMINDFSNDFKIFPIILLRQLDFGATSVQQLFYVYCKGKTPFFFICGFIVA